MWESELECAKKLAIEAGRAIMEVYNTPEEFKVEYKENDSPLTQADKVSNKIIVKGLMAEFPGYAVLTEEEKDNPDRLKCNFCFVVDPLDGTKEFIKRNGEFTVNIALTYQHVPVLGVIYVPATEELYYASKGKGAFKRSKEGQIERLHVSACTDVSKLKVVMSSSHNCREMDELIEKYGFNSFVKIGSSLKGCMIAAGKADIYYRYNPTMEWDTAAMQCIVEEAGGIFRQMDDTPMMYNRENSLNEKGFYAVNQADNVFKL